MLTAIAVNGDQAKSLVSELKRAIKVKPGTIILLVSDHPHFPEQLDLVKQGASEESVLGTPDMIYIGTVGVMAYAMPFGSFVDSLEAAEEAAEDEGLRSS